MSDMKRFVLHVTKRTGYLEVKIVSDFGGLTEKESDLVLRTALAQFGQYSTFAGPGETREVHGDYAAPDKYNEWVGSVCFDPGQDVDFEPVTNRIPAV